MNAFTFGPGPEFGPDSCVSGATPVPQKLRVLGRHTSVRMECGLWEEFDSICGLIGTTRQRLASRIAARALGVCGMTRAIRMFLLRYWQVFAQSPGATPDMVVRRTLEEMLPRPEGANALATVRLRDAIAPHLTPARARAILAAGSDDPARVCLEATRAWGEPTPWGDADPALVGRALIDLVTPALLKH